MRVFMSKDPDDYRYVPPPERARAALLLGRVFLALLSIVPALLLLAHWVR